MVVYVNKGLFLVHVTCPDPVSVHSTPIFVSGLRLEDQPYLGYAGPMAKGKSSGKTMSKVLKHLFTSGIYQFHSFYLPKQDTQLSLLLISVGLEI